MNNNPFTDLPVIGLVGGIGSGKSSVAREFARRQQFVVIDADTIGHAALQLPDVQQKIRDRFGDEVFDQQGTISRTRLAQRVFGAGQESDNSRRDLNKIVHPVIRERIRQEIRQAHQQAHSEPGSVKGVLLDAAILLETGWGELCDALVFVEADEETRKQRVKQTRGWDASDWRRREQSQLDLPSKRKAADATIDNTQDLQRAVKQLEEFLASDFFAKPGSLK